MPIIHRIDRINLYTTTLNFTIVSVYFEQTIAITDFKCEMQRILDFLQNFSNVILTGDFNARFRKWGDYVDMPRGVKLVTTDLWR